MNSLIIETEHHTIPGSFAGKPRQRFLDAIKNTVKHSKTLFRCSERDLMIKRVEKTGVTACWYWAADMRLG